MVRYLTLEDVSYELLYDAFLESFQGFPIVSKADLHDFNHLLESNGYDPKISVGAFHAHTNELVAFVLNSMRESGNEKTAYIILIGTKPSFRRQGIMSNLFKEAKELLKREKAARYDTEVLVKNTPALQFYQAQGFRVEKEITTVVSVKAGDEQILQYEIALDL